MSDDREPLGRHVSLLTKQIDPGLFPDETFDYYSIPAFDEHEGPAAALGATIESGKFLLSRPAVLVSKLNPRKMRVQWYRGDDGRRSISSTEFMVFEPLDSDRTSDRYLKHLLNGFEFARRLQAVATGTTNSHVRVRPKETLRWDVLLPPLEEQRRIAELLDSIDETIQATERVIAKLEIVVEGIALGSQLGEPDHGAGTTTVGSVSATWAGSTPHRSENRYYGGGIPWVKSGEVAGPTIKETEESVTDAAVRECSLRMVQPGTPLVAMYGATAGKVGWLGVGAVTNQAVLAVDAEEDRVAPRWLYWALRAGTRRLLASLQGSGQPNLNKGIIERMPLMLPDLDEQRATASRLDSAVATIDMHKCELEKLRKTRTGLATDLLSGRVRTVAA